MRRGGGPRRRERSSGESRNAVIVAQTVRDARCDVRCTQLTRAHVRTPPQDAGQSIAVCQPPGQNAHVLRICRSTGSLSHSGLFGVDVFASSEDAMIHFAGVSSPSVLQTGRALLGCAVVGDSILLLLAIKSKACVVLPSGENVFTVVESKWLRLPLKVPCSAVGKKERKSINLLMNHSLDGRRTSFAKMLISHDLNHGPASSPQTMNLSGTAGFGSRSMKLVSATFAQLCAADTRCAQLIHQNPCEDLLPANASVQEMCSLRDANDISFCIALFARRSSLHPGTRYLARGLNEHSSPGNEVECELLVWKSCEGDPGAASEYSSHVWRRGTVPIWWKQEIRNTVGDTRIQISDNPYSGTAEYFTRLRNAYSPSCAQSADENDHPSCVRSADVHCINLLRCAPGDQELILSEHFQEGIREAQRAVDGLQAHLLNFDWHGSVKGLGQERAVEGLWSMAEPVLGRVGFSLVTSATSEEHSKPDVRGAPGSVLPPDKYAQLSSLRHLEPTECQQGIMRYNCADSLDRTNLASFFVAVKVLMRQCERLGIDVRAPQPRSTDGDGSTDQGLPDGWERRQDPVTAKTYYINHTEKTTTWQKPARTSRWQRAQLRSSSGDGDEGTHRQLQEVMPAGERANHATVDDVRSHVLASFLEAVGALFQGSGDTQAACYTGTKTLHSSMINIFSNEQDKQRSGSSAASNLSNLGISVKRRYTNIMSDSSRQQQLEMMLGVRHCAHFPNVALKPSWRAMSWPPAGSLTRRIVRSEREIGNQLSLLCASLESTTLWSFPKGADAIDLCVQLSHPSVPQALVIAEPRCVPDERKPQFVEAYAGPCLDMLRCILHETQLPRAVDAHARDSAGNRHDGSHFIYCVHERLSECNFVVISLKGMLAPHAESECMASGAVEVLGESEGANALLGSLRSASESHTTHGDRDLMANGGCPVFSDSALPESRLESSDRKPSLSRLLFPTNGETNRIDEVWEPLREQLSSACATVALPLRSQVNEIRLHAADDLSKDESLALNVTVQVGDTVERLDSKVRFEAQFTPFEEHEVRQSLGRDGSDAHVGKIVAVALSHPPPAGDASKPPRLKRIELRGRYWPIEVPGGPSQLANPHHRKHRSRIARSKLPTRDMYSEDGNFVELTLGEDGDHVCGFRLECPSGSENSGTGVTQHSEENAVIQVSAEEAELPDAVELQSDGDKHASRSSAGSIKTLGRFTVPGVSERSQIGFDLGKNSVIARRVALSVVNGPFTLSNVQLMRSLFS